MIKYVKLVFCILILMLIFKGYCFYSLLFIVTFIWNKNLIVESLRYEVMGNFEWIDFFFDKNKLLLIFVDLCIDYWFLWVYLNICLLILFGYYM